MIAARHYVVGTAGHIDHGKTQLVRALTGIDTDRLPEEKERGITIDLGFASLDLGDGVRLAFVDVPGHERFVKNMVAGVGGIDIVLLVVAADESVMPQTREHAEICSLLGVRRGLVALTKSDLVGEDLRELATLEIRDFLRGGPLEDAPVVPVSSRTGAGLEDLRSALRAVTGDLAPRDSGGLPRLPVDRCFSIRGFGTVVTGTLVSGTVAARDEMVLYPAGLPARVRRVEVHGTESESAHAGERTALNLQGIEVADVHRGAVVSAAGAFRPSILIDVELRLLGSAPAPLKDLARVRYHQGTGEAICRAKLLDRARLEPGAAAFAQLRLESSQVVHAGDRFILRRYSPARTIGGGRVLDPTPEKHRGRSRAAVALLEKLAGADPLERAELWVAAAGAAGREVEELVPRTGIPAPELRAALDRACAARRLVRAGDAGRAVYLAAEAAAGLEESVDSLLQAFHRDHPLEPGIGKEELRGRLFGRSPVEVFRHLIEGMVRAGRVALEGDRVRRASHRLSLSREEEAARAALERRFREGGLNPPTLSEIIAQEGLDAPRAEAIFQVLLRAGTLVRLRADLTLHAESVIDLKSRLLNFRQKRETIDVAEFKRLSGTTRKNAIPLLEFLDAEKVTRRVGNERMILPPVEPPPGEAPARNVENPCANGRGPSHG